MEGIELQFSHQLKILGLIIDRNLNFKPLINEVSRKAINLYKTISRATRAQWGLNSEIVRLIYLAVVEPTVLYAADCWAETTDRRYIERILNRLTRLFSIRISKGHKTNSLISSTLLAQIIPLALRAKENAHLYEIKRGKPIDHLPGRQLEIKISPFDLPHPSERETLKYQLITIQKDIETIGNDWPKIYTVGSKINNKVGAAITVWTNGTEIYKKMFRLESYCSVFQAELAAILRAIRYSTAKNYRKVNILSDSRSALECICDPTSKHPIAAEIRNEIKDDVANLPTYILQ